MSEATNGLGGRLPLLHEGGLDADARTLKEAYEAKWMPWAASVPFIAKTENDSYVGPFNPLLYSGAIGKAFLDLQGVETNETSLDERTREVVILAVGSVWQADYELYAHQLAAIKAGFSKADAASLAKGAPCDALKPIEALAQHIALALSTGHRLDDELYHKAFDAFGARGLVDLTMLAGCYMALCSLLNIFDVPTP